MKLDTLIRNTLNRVFPILHQIEENPHVIIKHEVTHAVDFATMAEQPYAGKTYDEYDVECIFVEEPLLITANDQPIMSKQQVFYIKQEDIPFTITMNDRLVFDNIEYKPKNIQKIFPFIKVSVEKTSV